MHRTLDEVIVAAVMGEASQLTEDEGVYLRIYLDSRGHPTFGIGTLITPDMPEFGMDVGRPVSMARTLEAFYLELVSVCKDLRAVFGDQFAAFPHEVRGVSANMMYHLGRTRYLRFVKMVGHMKEENWPGMKVEMIDSLWRREFENRSDRLLARVDTAIARTARQHMA